MEQRKYRFEYGEFGDKAELVITYSYGDVRIPPKLQLVAMDGAWNRLSPEPDSRVSKSMVKEAAMQSGLKLALRAQAWKPASDNAMTREVVTVGDNSKRLNELFNRYVQA